jgi:hypothetical protein
MLNLTLFLLSFCGGIFGAAFGGLNSFILCGVSVIVGTAIFMATGDASFNNWISWGPFLAPHIAFSGGMAAAAYAGRKGLLPSGKDVFTATLGLNSVPTLLIGGIFGISGYFFKLLFDLFPPVNQLPGTNTMALSITMNSFLIRFIFGKTGLFGKMRSAKNRWVPEPGEDWHPWHLAPVPLILISLAIGVPAAYIAKMLPTSVGLFFGFTALTLIFFQFGAKIPVTHHIALSAEFVTALSGNLWWGVAFAILAAFLSEIFACLFLIHGDTHIDPPTIALVVVYSTIPWVHRSEIFTINPVFPIVMTFFIAIMGFFLLNYLRRKQSNSQPVQARDKK